MSDPQEREWRFYVEDMVGFCSKVLSYTHELDASSFAGSGIHYDATLRNIEASRSQPTGSSNTYSPITGLRWSSRSGACQVFCTRNPCAWASRST